MTYLSKEYDGHLNFATDAWTSPNSKPFVVVTVHFEYDGTPILLLLDIVEVTELHSGVNLAVAFAKIHKARRRLVLFNVVHWYIITDQPCYQILGVTCDNASSNNAIVDMLVKVLGHFPGHANHV